MIDLDELKKLAEGVGDCEVVAELMRGKCFFYAADVIERLPTIIAALETAALVRDEGWLAERISDSLDVDWRPIDAARAIIAALPKEPDNAHD